MLQFKNLLLFLILFGTIDAGAQRLTIASFNVRYENPKDYKNGNGWQQRCPVICDLIRFHDFEIFGAQEVLDGQLSDMTMALPEYSYIGVGRNDGKKDGEYAPIFYLTSRFRLLDSGNFWLAEDTEHPGLGWDAKQPRICTWGKFKIKRDGSVFWFFNLHLDDFGVISRQNAIKLVLGKILEMCKNKPVILTGDFNTNQHDENYMLLQQSDILADCFEVAKIHYALNGTTNNFSANSLTNNRIDHIFIRGFGVERYGILTDTYRMPIENDTICNNAQCQFSAHTPSDHFPVKAVLTCVK